MSVEPWWMDSCPYKRPQRAPRPPPPWTWTEPLPSSTGHWLDSSRVRAVLRDCENMGWEIQILSVRGRVWGSMEGTHEGRLSWRKTMVGRSMNVKSWWRKRTDVQVLDFWANLADGQRARHLNVSSGCGAASKMTRSTVWTWECRRHRVVQGSLWFQKCVCRLERNFKQVGVSPLSSTEVYPKLSLLDTGPKLAQAIE